MSNTPLKSTIQELKNYYPTADRTEKIIIECALVATGADVIASTIPILAIPATITSCLGAVWVMYGKLCKELGITLKENVLKLLARAALSNIGANLAGLVLAMLIPGASVIASAVVVFVCIYLAGLIFLRLLLKLAKKSKNPFTFHDISEDEMEKYVKSTKVSKDDIKAARSIFKDHKENN